MSPSCRALISAKTETVPTGWTTSTPNANTLKVKLAGSLASISAIHLLKSFIDITAAAGDKPLTPAHEKVIFWQARTACAFLVIGSPLVVPLHPFT